MRGSRPQSTSAWHAAIQFFLPSAAPAIHLDLDARPPAPDASDEEPPPGPIHLAVGEPWPDVMLAGLVGKKVRLAGDGLPLVVEFGSVT